MGDGLTLSKQDEKRTIIRGQIGAGILGLAEQQPTLVYVSVNSNTPKGHRIRCPFALSREVPGSVEHDDGAVDFAVLHGLVGLVDLPEFVAAGDEFVDLQALLAV